MAKDLTAALHALTEEANGQTSRQEKKLPPAVPNSSIPERVGRSMNTGRGGSGIASPLVELSYASRTFHTGTTLLSSDGLFGLLIQPVKTITFSDANTSEVVLEFKAPT